MNFENPKYLHLLWLLIPLLLLYLYSDRRGKRFSGERGASSVKGGYFSVLSSSVRLDRGRRSLKRLLFLLAFFSLVLAVAGPRWGLKESVVERRGIDIVVALDLSRSMLAADISPSRIERARLELASFIDSRRGDRVGIVAFAGSAVVVCPLTMDYGAAKNFLSSLKVGMIPSLGTDLTGAIRVAADLMKGYAGREKVIVILTDGEDTTGDPLAEAAEASKKGAAIYTLGFGTKRGAPIPVYDRGGKIADYKKDSRGDVVISKLDGSLLEEMASKGKGEFFHGADSVSALKAAIERREKSIMSSRLFTLMEERFQYPLLMALMLFCVELMVRERRQ